MTPNINTIDTDRGLANVMKHSGCEVLHMITLHMIDMLTSVSYQIALAFTRVATHLTMQSEEQNLAYLDLQLLAAAAVRCWNGPNVHTVRKNIEPAPGGSPHMYGWPED